MALSGCGRGDERASKQDTCLHFAFSRTAFLFSVVVSNLYELVAASSRAPRCPIFCTAYGSIHTVFRDAVRKDDFIPLFSFLFCHFLVCQALKLLLCGGL